MTAPVDGWLIFWKILLEGVRGTLPNENWGECERRVYSIYETSATLNNTTICDSYYQTTNKRKNNNPKVQINMEKLKLCYIWCGLHMYFRFQT